MISISTRDINIRTKNISPRKQKTDFWANVKRRGLFDRNMSIRHGNKDYNFNGINGYWSGQSVIAIGNSKALQNINLQKLEELNTIGCNHLIDFWDKMKWYLVQDERFFKFSEYDFKKYNGVMFGHNRNRYIDYKLHPNLYFISSAEKPTEDINSGLYSRILTGTCVINLAIISGASKIYLLGLDRNKNDDNFAQNHFDGYTGATNTTEGAMSVNEKMYNLCKAFLPWKDKIINVCDNGYLEYFNSISIEQFNKILEENKI